MREVQQTLSPSSIDTVDWTSTFYQYANRIAHLYLLRHENAIRAHLVNIYFVNAADVGGPTTEAEWKGAIKVVESNLGLGRTRLDKYIHKAFVDVTSLQTLVKEESWSLLDSPRSERNEGGIVGPSYYPTCSATHVLPTGTRHPTPAWTAENRQHPALFSSVRPTAIERICISAAAMEPPDGGWLVHWLERSTFLLQSVKANLLREGTVASVTCPRRASSAWSARRLRGSTRQCGWRDNAPQLSRWKTH